MITDDKKLLTINVDYHIKSTIISSQMKNTVLKNENKSIRELESDMELLKKNIDSPVGSPIACTSEIRKKVLHIFKYNGNLKKEDWIALGEIYQNSKKLDKCWKKSRDMI